MATQAFSDAELERRRGFPDIDREQLVRFFTLTPADEALSALIGVAQPHGGGRPGCRRRTWSRGRRMSKGMSDGRDRSRMFGAGFKDPHPTPEQRRAIFGRPERSGPDAPPALGRAGDHRLSDGSRTHRRPSGRWASRPGRCMRNGRCVGTDRSDDSFRFLLTSPSGRQLEPRRDVTLTWIDGALADPVTMGGSCSTRWVGLSTSRRWFPSGQLNHQSAQRQRQPGGELPPPD